MKAIVKFLTERKLVVNIITLFIVMAGALGLMGLKQDLFPDANLDALMVTAIYPGASAKDVENNVLIPIEDELKMITGIKEFSSTAMENRAMVLILIDEKVKDSQVVKDKIFRDLAAVRGLPAEVENLDIIDLDPALAEIYEFGLYITGPPIEKEDFEEQIAAKVKSEKERALLEKSFILDEKSKSYKLSGELDGAGRDKAVALVNKTGYSYTVPGEKELYELADLLEKQILKLKGVNDIRMEGYNEREIKINVIQERLDLYYLSLNDVISSIKKRNVRIPGGTLETENGEQSIVTIGQFKAPSDVENVIIRSNYDRAQVTVGDIAKVEEGYKKSNIQVKVNSNRGLTIKVVKKAEADIIKTTDEVKNYLASIEDSLPAGIEMVEIGGSARTISSLLDIVKMNAIIGFILVFLLLLVFLMDIKTAFWTAFGIPMTMLITFAAMYFFGFSINIISLGAIAMLLGIIVDDSIIISESIYKYKERGLAPADAVYHGLKAVAAPIMVSITTTIVAFVPLFMIEGVMGNFIFVLPAVVVIALAGSLIEAFILLPSHLVNGKKKKKKETLQWFKGVEKVYKRMLQGALKLRYLIVLLFVGLLVFTIFIAGDSIKNFVLVDDDSSDLLIIKVETPEGNSLDETAYTLKGLERVIMSELKESELTSVKAVIGHHNDSIRSDEGYHKNWAILNVNLVPRSERERDADELIVAIREGLDRLMPAGIDNYTITKLNMGPSTGKPVNIRLVSNNDQESAALAKEISDYLASIEGVTDIKNSLENSKEELVIRFNYDKMAMLGMSVDVVAATIRAAYEGTIASSIQIADDDIDMRVLLGSSSHRADANKNINYLMNLKIPNRQGRLIKLKDIAYISEEKSAFAINHVDGKRIVELEADLVPGTTTSMKVMGLVEKQFAEASLTYPDVTIKFGGEAESSKESLEGLKLAFIVALVLIYFILVLLFNNLSQPFLIMLTIPFGITGAILAFIAHGVPLSFFGIVGIIGLSGVVVNDCVVMVDFINQEMRKGNNDNIIAVIVDGAKERLRPVILTTLTTVAGLLPTAYGFGGQSPLITPVALAMAYGLLFATFLTLIFIPSIYCIRMDIIGLKDKLFSLGGKGAAKLNKPEIAVETE